MPDFPGSSLVPLADDRSGLAISIWSGWSLGPAIGGTTTAAWPATNRAVLVPFRVPVPVVAYQMVTGTGTGTTGNFDLGIYDAGGNRLVSTGSTAKTVAGSERIVNITDTTLNPGLYYMAMSTDGTTAYSTAATPGSAAMCKLLGMREAASAFALPSSVTLATVSSAFIPAIQIMLRAE